MQTIISNKKEFINSLNSLIIEEGKKYNFSFEELTQAKTKKQLGFIFGGIVKQLALYFLETDGVKYDTNVIKEMLYDEIGIDEILYLPTGRKIVSKKSLSKMSKAEASEFINNTLIWIDNNTDCILPPAIRHCWTLHVTEDYINKIMDIPSPTRDEWYLSQIRKMNCLYCGKPNAEAHHIRTGFNTKDVKPPDYMAIPLCHECHMNIAHGKGEQTLIKNLANVLNGLDIKIFCKILYEKTKNHT